jgi:hypothetical protein
MMKQIKLFAAILLLTSITFSGCKKNDDNNNPSGSAGTMSLTVDGSDWSATLSVQAVNSSGVVNITGSDSNANQASVILYGVSATGTYQVGPANPSNQLRWTAGTDPMNTYQANGVIGSGTVTITELTATKAVGTFQFTGYNTAQQSKVITNGAFDVNFN